MTQRLLSDWRQSNTGIWLKRLKMTHARGGSVVSDILPVIIPDVKRDACRIYHELGDCRRCTAHLPSRLVKDGEVGCACVGEPDWTTWAINTGIGLEQEVYQRVRYPKTDPTPRHRFFRYFLDNLKNHLKKPTIWPKRRAS